MARNVVSEWERYQAAQRREAERWAREAARRAREHNRELKQQYLASRQREAEARTAAVEQRILALDQVLTSVLGKPPLSFTKLRRTAHIPAFEPGHLGAPRQAPQPQQFAVRRPGALSRLFGGEERFQRRAAEAEALFAAAVKDYQQREKQRQRDLNALRTEYEAKAARERAAVTEHNTGVDRWKLAFAAGEVEAVERFVSQVLERSRYPEGFERRFQVAYRPEKLDVVVEFELPSQEIVPAVRGFRYVKTRDAVDPQPRPVTEVKQRYARLIASVALRTLHEIFAATPVSLVEAVVFNGRVSTVDRATGKNVRPHLLSVEAKRSAFAGLVLGAVEPAACLKHLNALVSPNPFDLEAIEPFIAFDLKRFRFTDNLDVVAGLDSRRNLLKLSPTEFEHLVRQLFEAMGAEAWNTIPSKDGGVDAVATSKNLFFGGVCLIQAKRYTGVVGLEAVHALTGVMADHNATTGVLVTTSWFGKASEQFAQRNRITLINGAELKHLIKEHLNLDVIPGTTQPTRARASDNRQTGRTG